MDVRCERCRTEYEFDDAKITEAGVTVKCTVCGHLFKVKKKAWVLTVPVKPEDVKDEPIPADSAGPGASTPAPAPAPAASAAPMAASAPAAGPAAPENAPAASADKGGPPREWKVRQANGNLFSFKELTTLQKWIVERKVTRDDEISLTGESWKRLGNIAELASFFQVVEAADRASASTAILQAGFSQALTAGYGGFGSFPASPGMAPTTPTAVIAAPPPLAGGPLALTPALQQPIAATVVRPEGAVPAEPGFAPGFVPAQAVWEQQSTPVPAPLPEVAEAHTPIPPPAAPVAAPATMAFTMPPIPEPAAPAPVPVPSQAHAPAPVAAAPGRTARAASPEFDESEIRAIRGSGAGRMIGVVAALAGIAIAIMVYLKVGSSEPAAPAAEPAPPAAAPAAEAQPGPGASNPAAADPAPPQAPALPPLPSGPAPAIPAAPPPAAPPEPSAAAPAAAPGAPAVAPGAPAAQPSAPAPAVVPPAAQPAAAQPAPAAQPAAAPAKAEKSFDWYIQQANRKRERGQAKEALALYEKAADLDPESPEPPSGRGYCLLDLGNVGGAIGAFQKALSLNARFLDAILGLAETYKEKGDKAKAVEYYQRYLDEAPSGPDAEVARSNIERLKD